MLAPEVRAAFPTDQDVDKACDSVMRKRKAAAGAV